MAEELGTRDVVEQLDKRLDNLEQGQRDLAGRLDRMNDRIDDLRRDMDRRFGRLDAAMVTVLLALVIGVGGLWLR